MLSESSLAILYRQSKQVYIVCLSRVKSSKTESSLGKLPFALRPYVTKYDPRERHIYPKSFSKQPWQYGLSFCSLKVPLFSCFRQNAHTKCSGWNLRNIAVMQRPEAWMKTIDRSCACYKNIWELNSKGVFYICIRTSDRLMTTRAQGTPLGVIVRLAIRQSFVIEERTSLELLSAILQSENIDELKKIVWKKSLHEKT